MSHRACGWKSGYAIWIAFLGQSLWRGTNMPGNWQLVMLPPSGHFEFNPHMVHDNFSAPLWVVWVFRATVASKLKQQLFISPEPGSSSKLTQVLKLTPDYFRRDVSCPVPPWPRHWNCAERECRITDNWWSCPSLKAVINPHMLRGSFSAFMDK